VRNRVAMKERMATCLIRGHKQADNFEEQRLMEVAQAGDADYLT
jgi:hypothetical protein